MSILQVDGITFGNATQLNTYYGIIPASSTMVFFQASAPTGWTKSTSQNNKALRVVSGTGGGTGGTNNFTSIFADAGTSGPVSATISGTVGDTTLTTQQIPGHTHDTGSQSQYTSSAGSSPFRTDNRQPRGYNIRAERRVIFNNRVQINFRQPVNVRQPRNYRQEQRQRVPLRQRQPRDFRVRYEFRNRVPFNFRVPINFRVEGRWRNPFSFRVDAGRWRNPIGQPWRADRRGRQRRPVRRGGRRRRNNRIDVRVSRRQPNVTWWRQRRQVRNPVGGRWRNAFRQPNSFRQPNVSRWRNSVRNRQPRTFRVRYEFRQRNAFRVNIPFRVTVPQRNPASYRQPRAYRVVQRYPLTSNVRVPLRTLTPGGTIRGVNTQAPATSSTGGGLAHNHPFNPAPVSWSVGLSPLRVQYIDVILCSLDDAATKFGI